MIAFDTYYKFRVASQAFSVRDIQVAGVIFDWITASGFSVAEFRVFAKMFPYFTELERIGYFIPNPGVEQSEKIKMFENTLPKDVKREVRKARLKASLYGYLSKG